MGDSFNNYPERCGVLVGASGWRGWILWYCQLHFQQSAQYKLSCALCLSSKVDLDSDLLKSSVCTFPIICWFQVLQVHELFKCKCLMQRFLTWNAPRAYAVAQKSHLKKSLGKHLAWSNSHTGQWRARPQGVVQEFPPVSSLEGNLSRQAIIW